MSHDLLSAYLDDELSPAERARVEADLVSSPELRRELAELDATRSLLRALPPVSPLRPLQTGRAVPPPSRRVGRFGLAVGAVAAVWLVVLTIGVSLGSLPVVPDVDQLALQHAAADGTGPMGFVAMDMDDMKESDAAVMDDIGHGMGLDAVFQSDDIVHARYSDGVHAVSIFHEPGEVDWAEMPADGDMEMMDDGPIWRSSMGDVDVLVTQRGDLVVTIVADGDMADDMVTMASTMVPEVDMDESFWSRLKAAPGNLFDRF